MAKQKPTKKAPKSAPPKGEKFFFWGPKNPKKWGKRFFKKEFFFIFSRFWKKPHKRKIKKNKGKQFAPNQTF